MTFIITIYQSLKIAFITFGYAGSYRLKSMFGIPVSFQDSAQRWALSVIKNCNINIEVIGKEHIPEQAVFIVNHRSSADIFVLLAILPKHSVFVYKHELLNHPLIGIGLRQAPYIPVDRSSPRASAISILKAKSMLKDGNSIIIFPEGTWSYPPNDILPFKQGSLMMASKTGVPIIPIAMVGTETITKPDGVLIYSGTVKVLIGTARITNSHDHEQAELYRNEMQSMMDSIQ
ncbi:MAG: 1-acyl-sn-glycerol-3-phosphate acyltransferase [Bacteroidetes bacterium]|nr:1-acyl-sn-glycerol-3-phosphate acyltransferase [Bacteroidota bacterium]